MTSRHYLFFAALLCVAILDVVTTALNLASGTMVEGGPFIAGIVESVPVHLAVKVSFALIVFAVFLFVKRRFGDGWVKRVPAASIEAVVFVPCTLLLSVAVANNLYWLFLV